MRPGEKFADAELMGIPYRVVISDRTLADDTAELTDRRTGESRIIKISELMAGLWITTINYKPQAE